MDIARCRELVVLADCLSFSEAAQRLFLTQSTLSKHVVAAERELGLRLFDRSTTHVELTKSGCVLIEGLRDVIGRYDRAVRDARMHQAGPGEPVRVVGPFLNERVSNAIATAHAELCRQGLDVALVRSDTGVRDCLENLLEGQADIAIVFRYGRVPRGLYLERLFELPFGVACQANHPLARRSRLMFADLIGCHTLSYPLEDRRGYHEYVAHVCRKHGIEVPLEHAQEGSICLPMSDDQVVFGVYFPGYARTGGDLVSRPLDDMADTFEVCAARRKREARPEVLALYEAIVRECYPAEANR